MQIGFVGLGNMGNPMVRNLLKAGHTVKVFDINPEAMAALAGIGAHATSSVADLAKDCETMITMLQTGEQVTNTCLDTNGLFNHATRGCVYIDSSSIDIASTQHLHQEAEKRGIAMIDAPVSGGTGGAAMARLTFMVGGTETALEKAMPTLTCMGRRILHMGGPSCGQAAKICNNLILGISMIGVCEGFNLAKKLGLEPKKFFELASNASAQCWALNNNCPEPGILDGVPSNNHYKPGFAAKMMLKDLCLAKRAAENIDSHITMGSKAIELYTSFVEQGQGGDMDFSAIIKFLANELGRAPRI